jgi:ribonuclease E
VPEAERLLAAMPVAVAAPSMDDDVEEDEADMVFDEAPAQPRPAPRAEPAAEPAVATVAAATTEDGEQRKRRRRRRRGGRREGGLPGDAKGLVNESGEFEDAAGGEDEGEEGEADTEGNFEPAEALSTETLPVDDRVTEDAAAAENPGGEIPAGEAPELDENGEPKARRRGRRGGRRRRRPDGTEVGDAPASIVDEPAPAPIVPAYVGPTPADPFNNTYDIFDMLEQAEEAAARPAVVKQVPIQPHAPEPAPELDLMPEILPAEVEISEPVVVEPAAAVVEVQFVPEAVDVEPVAPVEPEVPGEPEPNVPAKRGWWRR